MARTERILALENPGYQLRPMLQTVSASELFSNLLSLPREKTQFDEIQSAIINATGAMLPDSVCRQMSFDALNWELLLKHNALSAIFVGTRGEDQGIRGIVELRSSESAGAGKKNAAFWVLMYAFQELCLILHIKNELQVSSISMKETSDISVFLFLRLNYSLLLPGHSMPTSEQTIAQ